MGRGEYQTRIAWKEKSEENIKAGELLEINRMYNAAISRYYYGIFLLFKSCLSELCFESDKEFKAWENRITSDGNKKRFYADKHEKDSVGSHDIIIFSGIDLLQSARIVSLKEGDVIRLELSYVKQKRNSADYNKWMHDDIDCNKIQQKVLTLCEEITKWNKRNLKEY